MNRKQIRHFLIAHVPFLFAYPFLAYSTVIDQTVFFIVPIHLNLPLASIFSIACIMMTGLNVKDGIVHWKADGLKKPVWNPKVEAEKERLKGI